MLTKKSFWFLFPETKDNYQIVLKVFSRELFRKNNHYFLFSLRGCILKGGGRMTLHNIDQMNELNARPQYCQIF